MSLIRFTLSGTSGLAPSSIALLIEGCFGKTLSLCEVYHLFTCFSAYVFEMIREITMLPQSEMVYDQVA